MKKGTVTAHFYQESRYIATIPCSYTHTENGKFIYKALTLPVWQTAPSQI